MRILVIGANGQLGSDLIIALHGHRVLGTARGGTPDSSATISLDVSDAQETQSVIAGFAPDVVINTAAFHRVDDIEKDAGRAFEINALAAHRLALTCRDAGCALMHISTDYVFDGAKRSPYLETDPPNPLSAYGASKLAGELLIRAAWHKHCIVRTCGLYGLAGASGKGGNFVNTMLRMASEGKTIKVVSDQVCTPTYTSDLAERIAALIETGTYGTYHITSAGQCTWHDFATEIFRLAGVSADLQPISSAEFGAPARRPPYSVLDHAGLRGLGIDRMRPWQEALAEYVTVKLGG
jgi:dTDP-4-dehydrorhamnose reductase